MPLLFGKPTVRGDTLRQPREIFPDSAFEDDFGPEVHIREKTLAGAFLVLLYPAHKCCHPDPAKWERDLHVNRAWKCKCRFLGP